jgi:exodeoxyribonuclease-1
MIKSKQPELFDHLFKHRQKAKVKAIVESGKPFMYTSGRFSSEYLHTTAAVLLARHPTRNEALVYDLRVDPDPFLKMSVDEIIAAWRYNKDPDAVRLPVKTLKYNHSPAVVPGVVRDEATLERLQLSRETIAANLAKVTKQPAFVDKLLAAVERMDQQREATQTAMVDDQLTVDERLYDGFIDGGDKQTMRAVRVADPAELSGLAASFRDSRLKSLLPLYKARNYPQALSAEERAAWEEFIRQKLFSGGPESRLAKYFARLEELQAGKLNDKQRYIIEELRLYGESMIPADAAG